MKETIEHNNRFYRNGEELKTESEQLKEWLMIANKEIERLNENNQAMQEEMARTWKKLDEKENIIKEVREYVIQEMNNINPITYINILEILDKEIKL